MGYPHENIKFYLYLLEIMQNILWISKRFEWLNYRSVPVEQESNFLFYATML